MENWYSKLYDKKDVTDPFVDVKLGKARIAKTAIITNSLNPVWDEWFKIEVGINVVKVIFWFFRAEDQISTLRLKEVTFKKCS